MTFRKCVMALLICASCGLKPRVDIAGVSGERAMEHVRAQVAFGPRPPGSQALQKCRDYILKQLRSYGYQIEEDSFEAVTPYGPKRMVNLIARKNAAAKRIIVLASHYDGKYMEGIHFVGANDGGSSTGLLIELARVLADTKSNADHWFLFLDGEEAFIEWSTFDSTYGSRHLAQRWKNEGIVPRIGAFILLDMIGDKDLDILRESQSTRWLNDLVTEAANKAGVSNILSAITAAIEDDHLPFLGVGIPSVDIIDLNYGPHNSFHHTAQDTLDKVSPESLEKTGRLVLALLPMVEERISAK
jgi:glutaminyl-peptide cyclotransferase